MEEPGRQYDDINGVYRYGFNGQEKSTEIDPNGNINTAKFWEYDSRIGRRWNTDPVGNPFGMEEPGRAFMLAGSTVMFQNSW
jgi:hypothetical protein